MDLVVVGLPRDWFWARGAVIHRLVADGVSVGMMPVTIGAYQAMYFESVAQAVDYCHALVPHIVSRHGLTARADERAVVWFHVPARSQSSTREGCYLFASAGAVEAAERAGLDPPLCGRVTRAALPPEAVLLFGDDAPPTPARHKSTRRSNGALRAVALGTNSALSVDARV